MEKVKSMMDILILNLLQTADLIEKKLFVDNFCITGAVLPTW